MDYAVFPASAGVIPSAFEMSAWFFSFPRIRGGDPHYDREEEECLMFSPHPRG